MNILKKIFKVTRENKSESIIFIIVLMFISSILETISIALLIPLISTIINQPNDSFINDFMSQIIFYLTEMKIDSTTNKKDLIIPILILFSAIVSLKVFIIIYFTNIKGKFKYNLVNNVAKKMFSIYLGKSYNFFTKVNSSILIRNSSAEIDIFANSVINILTLINEMILFFFILSFLLFFNVKVTLFFLIIFSIFSAIFIFVTKNKITSLAKERQLYQGKTFQYARETFSAIKEIIIYNKFNYFLNQYLDSYKKINLVNWTREVLQVLPKHLLEYLMFITIFIFIFISINFVSKVESIITILTILAAAGYKLLPGLNTIISSIQQVKLAAPAINTIYDETRQKQDRKFIFEESIKKVNFEKDFELKNISFGYNNGTKVLNDLNFKFKKGETIGIFGPSGSGKSTLMDLITGVYKIDKGEIFIDGKKFQNLDFGWKSKIGYVPQNTYLFDGSFQKNIAFGIPDDKIDNKKLSSAIDYSGLRELINSYKDKDQTIIGEKGISLSGGQRQRIGIARALYLNPDIIILDESLNSLDLITETKIIDAVKKLKNKTLIIVSHRKSTLEKCKKIYKVDEQKIYAFKNDKS